MDSGPEKIPILGSPNDVMPKLPAEKISEASHALPSVSSEFKELTQLGIECSPLPVLFDDLLKGDERPFITLIMRLKKQGRITC